MDKEKKKCLYPGCIYYHPKAKTYCCLACSWDHHDMLIRQAASLSDAVEQRATEHDYAVGKQ